MQKHPSTLTLWLACWLMIALASLAAAQTADWPAPNWLTEDAQATAKSVLTAQNTAQLNYILLHQPDALRPALEALVKRNDLPWPIREAALMQFLDALASQRYEQVPQDALDYLSSWQSQTRVPHEEMAALGTPLYDIAARAQGLHNRWRREAAVAQAARALQRGPNEFLDAWSQQSDTAVRAGFLDALANSDRPTQAALLAAARAALHEHTEYAELAAHAALALRDLDAMLMLITEGVGADRQLLLRACAEQLSSEELYALLLRLRRDAGSSAVALAIGLWSSQLSGNAEAEAWLLDLLADPVLGSSAALALSLNPSPLALARLRSLAAAPDTSARAVRARLALQLDQVAPGPQ